MRNRLGLMLLFLSTTIGQGEEVVYESDFTQRRPLTEWSVKKVAVTPKSDLSFLGEFTQMEGAYFSLFKLPEHQFLRLEFELLVLKSADGTIKRWGNDYFWVMIHDGPLLLQTTFANKQNTGKPMKRVQAYPDEYPVGVHDPATGAVETPDLGYKSPIDFATFLDSTYRMNMIVPHADTNVTFKFLGRFTHGKDDESWGIRKIKVSTIDAPAQKNDAELNALWDSLSGDDPVKADQALWDTIAGGPSAYDWIDKKWLSIETKLQEEAAAEEKLLRGEYGKQVARLEAERFKTRKEAQAAIINLGVRARPWIETTLRTMDLPETSSKLDKALIALIEAAAEPPKQKSPYEILASRMARLRRIIETANARVKITSSIQQRKAFDTIGAPNDGVVPHPSFPNAVPRYTWYPKKGTTEWLQYTYPEAKTVSKAKVFWYTRQEKTNDPKSWKVLYRNEANEWQPVEAKGPYSIRRLQFDTVEFTPVKTEAVRLEVVLPDEASSGVLEFRVEGPSSR